MIISHVFNDPAFLSSLAASGVITPPTADGNLWAWFSSDTGVTNSSSKINVGTSVWTDRSGLSHHLDVATSEQPSYYTISTTIPSGKPEVVFENIGQTNRLTMPSGITNLTVPYTIYMLVKVNATANNKYLCDGLGSSFGSGGIVQHTCAPCVQGITRTGATAKYGPMSGGLRVGEWHIIMVIYDGTNTTTQIDNAYSQTNALCGTDAPGRLCIGNYGGGGPNSAKYSLGAFIVCLGASNSTNQTIHKNWLANYGGLTITAPSSALPTDDPNIFSWHSSDTGLANNGTIITAGGSAWTDRSGLGKHMQVNSSNEPGYISGGPNGHPAIHFANAGSKTILHNASTAAGLQQPWSLHVLMRHNTWTSNRYLWDGSSGTTGAVLQDTSTPQVCAHAGVAGTHVSPTLATWLILSVIYDGAASVIQINNNTEVVSNHGTNNPGTMVFGNYGGGGANSGDWDLAAAIVASGHTGSAGRTLHKNWLAAYGGLTI